MDTAEALRRLLNHLSKRPDFFVLTTNLSWILPFEADVFQITKDKKIIEYEIKVSRGDFLKDKYKKRKTRYGTIHKMGYLKGEESFRVGSFQEKRPHKFYYVAPSGIILRSEVDRMFGLIEILPSRQVYISKRAALLHDDNRASQSLIDDVYRNFCLKQCLNGF